MPPYILWNPLPECLHHHHHEQVKPSGAASQFMDLLEGLFHPHNLTYVRCCQAALTSAIVRDNLGEALVVKSRI